jgi:tRNA dimethylallyltransferase
VLLVGGSGLYYRAVVDGLDFPGTDPATRGLLETEAAVLGPDAMYARLDGFDAAAAARTTASNARRIVRALEVAAVTGRPFSGFATAWNRYPRASVRAAGLLVPREVLRARIDHRARTKFPRLLDEVRGLVRRGYGPFITSSHVIGYAEAAACLDGSLSSEDAIAKIARRDRALARRQMAWFRRDPRIRWFDTGDDETGPLVDRLIGYLGHRETSLAGAERVGAEGR